jgi:uncharacterized protein
MVRRNITIWFYGGEPLLEFDLIKRAVKYAQRKRDNHYILSFGISTNLTLITPEKVNFLRENKVFLSVSLDGPEEDHDRNRRFADGRPTFKVVMNKLDMIRRLDGQYFKERVKIIATLTGHSRLRVIRDFFNGNAGIMTDLRMVNFIKEMVSGNYHKNNPYCLETFEREYANIIQDYLKEKKAGHSVKEGEFLYRLIEESLLNTQCRLHSFGITPKDSYTGTCFPGRKIALAPNGFYYTCERVDYNYPIGRVETGLDYQMIRSLLIAYNEALPDCTCCWARNLCGICFAAVNKDNRFDFSQQCQATRRDLAAGLILLYSMLEENPTAIIAGDQIIDKRSCPEQRDK